MKKVFVLLAVALLTITTTAMAQGRGNFNPAAMKERQLKMLKESDLKLTDVQADSVIAINWEFLAQQRGMRDLSREERQTKMKDINDAKMKRMTIAFKDVALAKRVAKFYEKQRAERAGKSGGARVGGGTPPSNK